MIDTAAIDELVDDVDQGGPSAFPTGSAVR
jgi:hypothetical protein